jgi:hypothetical protein
VGGDTAMLVDIGRPGSFDEYESLNDELIGASEP